MSTKTTKTPVSQKKRALALTPSPTDLNSDINIGSQPRKNKKARKKANNIPQKDNGSDVITDTPTTSSGVSRSISQSISQSATQPVELEIEPVSYIHNLLETLDRSRQNLESRLEKDENPIPSDWENELTESDTETNGTEQEEERRKTTRSMGTVEEPPFTTRINPYSQTIHECMQTIEFGIDHVSRYIDSPTIKSVRKDMNNAIHLCFENCKSMVNFALQEKSQIQIQYQAEKIEWLKEKQQHEKEKREMAEEMARMEQKHMERTIQLMEQLQMASTQRNQTKSWAEIANTNAHLPQSSEPPRKPEYAIIIGQKDEKSTQDTDTTIKTKIHPLRDQITPIYSKKVSNNRVIMAFNSKLEAEQASKKINEKTKELHASIASKKRPRIIIKGLPKDIPNEEIIENIRLNYENKKSLLSNMFDQLHNQSVSQSVSQSVNNQQQGNRMDTSEETPENQYADKIKIKFRIKNRNNDSKESIVVELDPQIYKTLIADRKISFNWYRYNIDIYKNVIQCLKCCRYGHSQKYCTSLNIKTCYHCTSNDHEGKDCPDKDNAEKKTCANCKFRNEKFNTNLDIKHIATDPNCKIRIEQEENNLRKTDFGN